MPQNRECQVCTATKPINKFKKYDLKPGYSFTCQSCFEKYRGKKTKLRKPIFDIPKDTPIDLNQKIDMSQLLNLDSLSDNEIKRLILCVITYRKEPHFMNIPDIISKHFPHTSASQCRMVIGEFKEAAKNGMEFDEALKTRKFRKDGKKTFGGKK